jgi:Fe-S cluster assembly protein SufD
MNLNARGSRIRSETTRRSDGLYNNKLRSSLMIKAVASAEPTTAPQDGWIAKVASNIALSRTPSENAHQNRLHQGSMEALRSLRMPSTRNEEYRFTDFSPLLKSQLCISSVAASIDSSLISGLDLPGTMRVVLVDGLFRHDLSNLSSLSGLYVGGLASAPPYVASTLGSLSASRGGAFSVLNGALASDALVISASPSTTATHPIHVINISTQSPSGLRSTSAPRILVHLGAKSSLELIQEFISLPSSSSSDTFTCALAEIVLEEGAALTHGYAEREDAKAIHCNGTLVNQAKGSTYSLTEARVGAMLSRHDVSIHQMGPDTSTTMKHFLISGSAQLHDLHTKLELNHPRGVASQLHKCIVAHSTGRGVFDGNVKVQQKAQQTDAQQLSRNLLLVPRATVNVKPNLQIVADDVKCTHGCTVSDLRDDELFYFRARGIDAESARRALVSSFGSEVTRDLQHKNLISRVQIDVSRTLATADVGSSAKAVSSDDDFENL